ncbi:AAA family ATPase [Rhodoferax sp. 4810]|nr:AAA family ATPase [Rhodoferax jenense]
MRVLSLSPRAQELEPLGLRAFELRRLGSIVVLAGPNGGGKSRILSLLRQIASEGARGDPASEIRRKLSAAEAVIDDYGKRRVAATDDGRQSFEAAIREQEQIATNLRIALAAAQRITWSPESQALKIVEFLPKSLPLEDPSEASRRQLRERHKLAGAAAKRDAVGTLGADALSYIQLEQDRHWDATHQGHPGSSELKAAAVRSYARLNELVKKLVGAELSRSDDGEVLLYGTPIGKVPLSDGQKVLLQLAVAVHPVASSEDYVLVLDEPENHLHPRALVEVLEQIGAVLPNAQIWAATHSVPLISHFYAKDPSSLHYVVAGGIENSARNPLRVLHGLLGDDTEQSKLLNFVDLPHKIALTQFAAECLAPPLVATHAPKDPQLRQIHRALGKTGHAGGQIRLLDLGAGKGRLLTGIAELLGDDIRRVDYVAFDISHDDREVCQGELQRIYGSSERRWYSKSDDLLADHGEGSFDVVVMCNVLHEIAPDDWLSVLGPSGLASKAGKSSGYLFVVEDLRIPVGERPNSRGFFLLDTLHLQKLFGIASQAEREAVVVLSERDGRLKCHAIPMSLVVRASADSRLTAIRLLRDSAVSALEDLRRVELPDFRSGQAVALWSHLLANCYLFLKSAGKE